MDNIRLIESVGAEITVDAPYIFALKDEPYVPSSTAVTSATISVDEKVTENKTATLRWMKHTIREDQRDLLNEGYVFDLSKFSTFKVDGVEQIPQTLPQPKSITYDRQELSITYDGDNSIFTVNGDFGEDLLFNDGDGYQLSFEDLTMAKGIYGEISFGIGDFLIFKIENENNAEGLPIGLYVYPIEQGDVDGLMNSGLAMLKPSKYTIVKIEETEVSYVNPQALTSITILPQKVYVTQGLFYSFTEVKEYYIEFDYKQGVTEVTKGMFQPSSLDDLQSYSALDTSTLTELSDNALDGITSIGDGAFGWCYQLKNIIIPNSVTSIDNSAFWACDDLRNVEMSSNISYIGYEAFGDCGNLTSVVYKGTTYTSIEEYSEGANALFEAFGENNVNVECVAFIYTPFNICQG